MPEETKNSALQWDLTEYFASDADFDEEIKRLKSEALPELKRQIEAIKDIPSLLRTLRYDDECTLAIARANNYAQSKADLNARDALAIRQKNAAFGLERELTLLSTEMDNRLLAMEEEFWNDAMRDESLASYWRPLALLRENASHILSGDEEKLLLPAYQAMTNVNSTFDVLLYSSMDYGTVPGPDGKEVKTDYTHYIPAMCHKDRAYRARFYKSYAGSYVRYRDVLAQNLNTYLTLSEELAKLHHYDCVLSQATKEHGVTAEVYRALVVGGRESAPVLLRDAEIRKKSLALTTLYNYDTRVPLGSANAPDFSYDECKNLLKRALAPLGEEYLRDLDTAFSERWIDVYPAENKNHGAYSGMSVELHPWILTNYTNDYHSVSTLAHELGHAVHQYRSFACQQSAFNKEPTAFVSEVASTTNELLLSRYMMAHAQTDAEKLYYALQELEALRGTFFAQLQFADFELQMHEIVQRGDALTADALDEIYDRTWRVYNPGVEPAEGTQCYWGGIPHFYYNFYVYAYALDIAIGCNVAEALGEPDMTERYLSFLSSGNSAPSVALFEKLGVDVNGTDYLKPLTRRYETLLNVVEELLA